MKKTKIVIADDHPLFRVGLRKIIEDTGHYELEEAADGVAALEAIERVGPEVSIVDLNMPLLDGLGVVRELRERRWPGRIIILTMHAEAELFQAALDQSVDGYMLKDSAVAEVLVCIEQVLSGQPYVSPTLSSYLCAPYAPRGSTLQNVDQIARLTASERRVLKGIAENKTSKEIAAGLGISPRTVENHRANISAKLDLHGAHSLLKFAFDHGASL